MIYGLFDTTEKKVENAKALIDSLAGEIEMLEKRNEVLHRELNEPTDEKLAEAYEKISELEKLLVQARKDSLILLTKKERETIDAWKAQHLKESKRCIRRIQCFEPHVTGIRDIYLECSRCGKTLRVR